jgi:lysophospholipase L1-like esterase
VKRPGRTRLLGRLAALGVGALMVVGAELLLSRTLPPPRPTPFHFAQEGEFDAGLGGPRHVRDALRFYTLAPDHRHAPWHAGRFATGPWPTRGAPPEPAVDGLRRVLLVGDSCIYGWGLSPAHTLTEQLSRAIAEEGWDPTRVQVLNLGVSGYSTVQIATVVREAMRELEPDVVVLYPAAWNDQWPAMKQTDEELAAQTRRGSVARALRRTAIYRSLRPWPAQAAPPTLEHRSKVFEKWNAGQPLYGTRVAEDRVGHHVRAAIDACREGGAEPLCIVPPHPPETRKKHPRVLVDADAVRAVTHDVGAIDGAEVFARAAKGGDETFLFLDHVHPGPVGVHLLTRELAPLVLEALGTPGEAPGEPLRVASLSPTEVSALGDARVRLELEGWSRDEPLPVVLVGGGPLLRLTAVGESAVEGELIGNAEGRLDVVVRTERGTAYLPGAIRSALPRLEWTEDEPPRLRCFARPGDRVWIATGAPPPGGVQWNYLGPLEVDREAEGAATTEDALVVGEDGSVLVPLELLPADRRGLRLQPYVLPVGEKKPGASLRVGRGVPALPE